MQDTPKITVYGTLWCPDVFRVRRYLDRHGIPYTFVDIDADREARAFITEARGGDWIVPTITFDDGTILFHPPLQELRIRLRSLERAE